MTDHHKTNTVCLGELLPRTQLETTTAPTTRMGWEMRKDSKFEESPPLQQKTKDVIVCPRNQAEPCVLCAMHPQLISCDSTAPSPQGNLLCTTRATVNDNIQLSQTSKHEENSSKRYVCKCCLRGL